MPKDEQVGQNKRKHPKYNKELKEKWLNTHVMSFWKEMIGLEGVRKYYFEKNYDQ